MLTSEKFLESFKMAEVLLANVRNLAGEGNFKSLTNASVFLHNDAFILQLIILDGNLRLYEKSIEPLLFDTHEAPSTDEAATCFHGLYNHRGDILFVETVIFEDRS